MPKPYQSISAELWREKLNINPKENNLGCYYTSRDHEADSVAVRIINVGFCANCKHQNLLLKILFNDSLNVINTKELLEKLT